MLLLFVNRAARGAVGRAGPARGAWLAAARLGCGARRIRPRAVSRSPCAAGCRALWRSVAGPVQGEAAFHELLVAECRA